MRDAGQVIDQEFLQIRAKILEVAAFLDRLAAAGEIGPAHVDKLQLLKSAVDLLQDDQANKAARVQLHFSRHFDPHWRQKLEV
jgi:hypothetical protein